jgi:hypothetical protein
MQLGPLTNEPQCAWRQRPVHDAQSAEFDLGDVLAALGVEVRRRMVRAIHPDHDSVERCKAGHERILGHRAADALAESR